MSQKDSKQLVSQVVKALDDKKAIQIVTLDLHNISLVTDYFVICHGNSNRQVQALADAAIEQIEKAGYQLRGVEGMEAARWVLIDAGDVVVHVFHREDREFYNLERLWSDAKVVETV